MRRFLRPSYLLVLLAVTVAVSAWWVYETTRVPARPMPLPVSTADREVAWLNAATAGTSWQRFVQAVTEATGVEPDRDKTFPRLTTAVPEIAVPFPDRSGHLRIRWYKVSGEWTTEYWMEALTRRNPPPLAIIGGNTTERATEQANLLRRAVASLEESRRPLLLLTTATADGVAPEKVLHLEQGPRPTEDVPLVDIYPGRTFRFCFTNLQMSEAVTSFIWGQPELQPDAFPVYAAEWLDDAYSRDLVQSFLTAMRPYLRRSEALATAREVALLGGFASGGGFPLSPLLLENEQSRLALYPLNKQIWYSVGSFDRPNLYETEAAQEILDDQIRHPRQRRALLVLSGQSGPSRRLVRAMCRLSPMRTRRFVLAAGDTISFTTIVRDRNVSWPIQDLPASLVFFCHHNPIGEGLEQKSSDLPPGYDDLRLSRDIVQALVLAGNPQSADELRKSLSQLRISEEGLSRDGTGKLLFEESGNRRGGTGEHVVWLRPSFAGERALPEATITVVAWNPDQDAWKQRGSPLKVTYTGER